MEEYVKKKEFDNFKEETNKRFDAIEEPIKEIQITSAKTLEKLENMDKNNDLKNQIIEGKIDTKIEPLKQRITTLEVDNSTTKSHRWAIISGIALSLIGVAITAIISILK